MRSGGKYELIKDRHGFVIGGMEDMKYKEYELILRRGDKLFLYTDGVPEAVDTENRMFGTERMLSALNSDPDAAPRSTIRNVRREMDTFTGSAEQFDDITMLALSYFGPDAEE
jgi:sigma-B regulation protein RsbU (phosphoserine phosphatase)